MSKINIDFSLFADMEEITSQLLVDISHDRTIDSNTLSNVCQYLASKVLSVQRCGKQRNGLTCFVPIKLVDLFSVIDQYGKHFTHTELAVINRNPLIIAEFKLHSNKASGDPPEYQELVITNNGDVTRIQFLEQIICIVNEPGIQKR